MGFRVQRKTFRIGSSQAVTLPASWCRYYADRITTLTMVGNGVLVLAPKGLESMAQKIIEEVEKDE